MIPRLHVPMRAPQDIVRYLGEQEKHWKEGRSAHALAHTWFRTNGIPAAVSALFQDHEQFGSVELIDAFLERQVDLGTAGFPSQTDILAVIGVGDSIAILAVEGKAGEPFGPPVHQWLDGSATRKRRLDALCGTLGLTREAAMPLRYQLLHRTASAIYEAKRYRTNTAVLVVQDFSERQTGLDDFRTFLRALRFENVDDGALKGRVICESVSLYAGWARDAAPKGENPAAYLRELRDYVSELSAWCDQARSWCNEREAIISSKA